MSGTSSVERSALKVSNTKSEIINKQKQLVNETYSINSWWKGTASDSFMTEFSQINGKITNLANEMDVLKSLLGNLARNVSRADEERRQLEIKRAAELAAKESKAKQTITK